LAHVRASTTIAAPIEQVWEFLTHTSNLPRWAAEEIEEATSDKMELGTAWTEKLRLAGRTLDVTWRIHEMTPPHRLAYVGAAPGGGKARGTHLLEPAPGGTQLTIEVEFTLPGGIFGQVADKLIMERRTGRDVQDMLGKAKAAVEATGPTPG
jgi:uncharacterized protein YndB with AHSA1/START domain